MPLRHRYATPAELHDLLAKQLPDVEPGTVQQVLDGLLQLGVPLDRLATITVHEEIPS